MAVVSAMMETGSDHPTNENHQIHLQRKIVKKDMKDGQNNDNVGETTQQVRIKQKLRVNGPSEGVHKVKVERDDNGNVIKPSFSKKILKEEAKKHKHNK